jgi:hypothetical protein
MGFLDDWFGIETPKPPDPYATADAQYQYNKQAAEDFMRMGSLDQFGPFGSTTYERGPDGLPTSQTVNLSPEVQSWLDSQFGASAGLSDAALRQIGYLPEDKFQLPTGPSATDYATGAFGSELLDPSSFSDLSDISQTSYDQARSLFEPDIENARNAMEVKLAQRGIPVGSEIYNQEMDRLDRSANQAYSGAARQAQLDAGNEQSRRFNTALQGQTFGQNQYQTNLSNDLLERNQPYAEASALLGTNPSFQTPSFMNTPTQAISSPDYQGQVNANYQAKANQSSGLWNTLGSLGSAFAGSNAGSAALVGLFSDEDMKEMREPVDGETILAGFRDMPIDEWNYTDEARMDHGVPGGRHIGPMAQDWKEQFGGDGKTIPVVDALGRLAKAVQALDKRTMRAA